MTRTYVSADRLTMVQQFEEEPGIMRVSRRPNVEAVWGPPVHVILERPINRVTPAA